MNDPAIEIIVIRKLAMEAFEMVFAGEYLNAKKVFSAIAEVKPKNRASELGFALLEFIHASTSDASHERHRVDHQDPIMSCIQGLEWLQQGRVSEAKKVLQQALSCGELPVARLAQCIISREMRGA